VNDHTPLLATKLFIPAPRVRRVVRDRLLERLEAGKHRPLTLIAAPAGSGKTTLVSEWLAACPQPAAWLSLDQSENDPASFWRHLLAAIRRVWPDFGQDVLDLFQSPQPPALAEVAGLIVGEFAGMDGSLTLVLDDYHAITIDSVHAGLATLLESLLPQLRVVMLTRSDPSLPLARMRARDQLTEIRAADLRFTPLEAAAFLRDCMGLDLQDQQVQALAARTEGWIAGLQLAALAVQGTERPQEFVDRFSGSHRFVLDYLTDEVLSRLPPDRLRFLLETAILDRLSGPLCDTLTGDEGGQAILEQLDRQNLFLVPLDDRRCWYRYHHLFRDVLRARLAPDRVAELQLRAAGWFEQQGLAAEAIPYALAAGDPERAAQVIEQSAADELFHRGEIATLQDYLAQLPQAVVADHPWLIIHQAWTKALLGNPAEASRLADAAARQAPGMANGDHLLGQVAAVHAYRALLTGEFPRAVACGREAMQLLAPSDWGVRGTVAFTLASCSHMTGDLDEAGRLCLLAEQASRECGNISGVLALVAHAEVLAARGRLHEASERLRMALRWADEHSGRRTHVSSPVLSGLGEVLRELGDLAEAERCLQEALARWRGGYAPKGIARAYVSLARLQGARGDFPALRRSLDAAIAHMSRVQVGVGAQLALSACAVQWYLAQGDVATAAAWVEQRLPSVEPAAAWVYEQEQIVRARLLLAQGRAPEARQALSRQAATARAGGRTGNWLAATVLEALAADAAGDRAAAVNLLNNALAAAEPEGYVRIFMDEGPAMVRLLEACGHRYASRLLGGTAVPPRTVEQHLVEPLTDREREVLGLIAGGLTNSEIGARLYISEGTVKRHISNIFGKLGVNHRTQALVRARELGLL